MKNPPCHAGYFTLDTDEKKFNSISIYVSMTTILQSILSIISHQRLSVVKTCLRKTIKTDSQ